MISAEFHMCEIVWVHANWERVMLLNLGECITNSYRSIFKPDVCQVGHEVHLVKALRYKPEGLGSIPNGVIGIFHWHDPSSHTEAWGSTQPLTEMSTRNAPGGWRRPVLRADNLTASCANCLEIWESQPPGTLSSCPGLYGGLLCLYLYVCQVALLLNLVFFWPCIMI
jgi:hypothetical protein